MSSIHNIDLNLPPEEDSFANCHAQHPSTHANEENSNHGHSHDINAVLVDLFGEEILHQDEGGFGENVNLNQPSLSEEEELQDGQPSKRYRMLSNEERQSVCMALLKESVNVKLRKGTIIDVAAMFSISTKTIKRIWQQTKATPPENGVVDVSHRKTKNCGRKRIHIDREQFVKVPLSRRTSLESLACAMNMSKSTLHRNVQSGAIHRHSNPFNPYLKDSNKKARVRYCLSMLDNNNLSHDLKFNDMYNTIHIDEKWFYISRKTEKYYLLPEECDPAHSCKSKNFLTKVMFLAAIARPRFDSDGNEIFSGKIGIFPFVNKESAKRSSANRVAGTLETKPMTSIGKDIGRSFLIEKVLPAIFDKWPTEGRNTPIYIQQDNAKTHINPNDEEFRLAVSRLGLDIHLTFQPPNSPDLNVLDLGFFNAIQNLHYKEACKSVDDIVVSVEKAFINFSSFKSNRIFLTLQQCMTGVMKSRGSISYKIPHMNKAGLERNQELLIQLHCDAKLVEEVTEWLNSSENV